MKLETLEDLLQIDTDANKAADNKALLRRLKQLLKGEVKRETNLEVKAESLPYEAISVVGNKVVTLKFDLETKEGIVTGTSVDTRDTGKKNYMAAYNAAGRLNQISKEQKEE